jgi:hypothetical protein
MLIRALLILCVLTPSAALAALAAAPLIRDVHYQGQADHIDLSVHLGPAVRISDIEEEDDGRRLRMVLEPASTSEAEWRFTELKFDEEDRLLDSVALEGSDRKGYELTLTFTAAVVAQVLPQFDHHVLLLKLATSADYRALSRAERKQDGDPYVINLQSKQQGVPSLEDLPPGFARTQAIYVTRFEQDRVLWHRYRLGFFSSQGEAQRTLNILRRYYPDAWLDQAGEREQRFARAFRINPEPLVAANETADETNQPASDVRISVELETPASLAQAPAAAPEPEPTVWARREPVAEKPPTELESLLDEARHAFEQEDWPTAISRYGAVVEADEEPYRQTALEMLGVARELNDQAAHAKRYYEIYLADYAGTEGAERVAQRLAVLTAFDGPGKSASKPAAVATSTVGWKNSVQFAQFYQRQSLTVDGRSSVPINGLINDLNLMSRRRGESLDQEFRVTMSYLADFTNNERLSGRKLSTSAAYWDVYSQTLNMGLRLGRQSNWETGALGRFDGAAFSYRPTDNLALGLTGGFLIDTSFDSPDGERPFFSFSGEYISDSGNLAVRPFFVQQQADGVIDRQALGASAQYYSERIMLFSLVDYDLHHSALNNITLTGNFTFGRSQLNASYEHRMSPYLTTRNALMGQTFDDLTELEEALLELSLEEIAKDRTAQSDTLRLGWNRRFGVWTFSADIVLNDFSSTETSVDVPGLEPHQTLYSSFQVRSADIFGRGSYSGLMLRVADSDTSDTTSLYWDNRFAFGARWFVYPRVRVDLRNFSQTGDEQTRVRPTLRVDYRMGRRIRLELESGYEWSTRSQASRDIDMTGFFIRAGYRANL